MVIPFKIIEEYVFYVQGIKGTVRARIMQQVLSGEERAAKKKEGLRLEEFSWDVSHFDNQPQGPHNYHPSSIEEARGQLIDYMNKFDGASSRINDSY
ncbi:hypothetical protein [Klebsiella oxytoca]|uniref:hypothetical protein n=1 Tax=Klebsiella oxytoca TaxID=571 RepID=UPI0025913A06|nr:hypothetical protein [Klebsiella oxytoca]MDM4091610.1 hypothetical protein [Klebsiella oxytoca]